MAGSEISAKPKLREQVLQALGSSSKSSLELTLSKAGGLGVVHCPSGNIFSCPSHSRKLMEIIFAYYSDGALRYLFDFYRHGQRSALESENRSGCQVPLRFIKLALEQVLNSKQQVPWSANSIHPSQQIFFKAKGGLVEFKGNVASCLLAGFLVPNFTTTWRISISCSRCRGVGLSAWQPIARVRGSCR